MARLIDWQIAAVLAVCDETPTVRSFTLGLPGWAGHRPGQHVDLRLTAEDGCVRLLRLERNIEQS